MTSAFLTLTKGEGHTTRSKVTDVEVSAFSEQLLVCVVCLKLLMIFTPSFLTRWWRKEQDIYRKDWKLLWEDITFTPSSNMTKSQVCNLHTIIDRLLCLYTYDFQEYQQVVVYQNKKINLNIIIIDTVKRTERTENCCGKTSHLHPPQI